MTIDPAVLAAPAFGAHFTDHMVLVDFSERNGWHDRRVVPYGPLDPKVTYLMTLVALLGGSLAPQD